MIVTEVLAEPDGDATWKPSTRAEWQEQSREHHLADERMNIHMILSFMRTSLDGLTP